MSEPNVVDKSLRSVFVGNIPYEATEEKLKDIFSEVGPVVSFKLVYDRETGKPKGYGFCEYRDQETALSAMRNLNGYEISGRILRVDNACTEKSRMEMQSGLLATAAVENPYGDAVEPGQAPEAISKAVASLPPEQMFELMKQMKASAQNNPNETRQMLLHNPQLAYALLQGLVAMRLVDPQAALSLLQKPNAPHAIIPTEAPASLIPGHLRPEVGRGPIGVPVPMPAMQREEIWNPPPAPVTRGSLLGDRPPIVPPQVQGALPPGLDMDLRHISDPRMGRGDLDLRGAPARDPRELRGPPMEMQNRDPRSFGRDMGGPRDPRDPRGGPGPGPMPMNRPLAGANMPPAPVVSVPVPMNVATAPRPSTVQPNADQEKAALIMQVLQLSDEQIALLPPEQRQSIMVLKDQIARSAR